MQVLSPADPVDMFLNVPTVIYHLLITGTEGLYATIVDMKKQPLRFVQNVVLNMCQDSGLEHSRLRK